MDGGKLTKNARLLPGPGAFLATARKTNGCQGGSNSLLAGI